MGSNARDNTCKHLLYSLHLLPVHNPIMTSKPHLNSPMPLYITRYFPSANIPY